MIMEGALATCGIILIMFEYIIKKMHSVISTLFMLVKHDVNNVVR